SGAPQVRFPHFVMARLCSLLRQNQPAVYQTLVDSGAPEVALTDYLTPTSADYAPEPGDDDLTAVRSRRTTVEWALRKAALNHDRVAFRGQTVVAGLVADRGAIPHVSGIRLNDGSRIDADLTVVSAGKRCKLPNWYTQIGAAAMPDETSESGVIYASRFYRLPAGCEFTADAAGVLTGGYLQGGVIEADSRTFGASVTVPRGDTELRRLLLEPGMFERLLRELPQFRAFADVLGEPISGVAVMAGVTNRWRSLTVDGRPLATGVVSVGDSLVCTNPVYGRGMSTTAWSVDLLAGILDNATLDRYDVVSGYAAVAERELKPWYQASVQMDQASQAEAEAVLAGEDKAGAEGFASVFNRLLILMRHDAVLLRGILRSTNLLASPNALMEDPELIRRIAELSERNPEAARNDAEAPSRADLIAMLTADREPGREAQTV
ncbi:hypothetical protein, partial [Mycobacterium sp.]|uniref:hypothetical protein n=1 Tax=Mycobacterium sp. TaxID=1785 RepID=UPI003BB1757C